MAAPPGGGGGKGPGGRKSGRGKGAPPTSPGATSDTWARSTEAALQRYFKFLAQLQASDYGTGWNEIKRLFPDTLGPMYTPAQLRNQANVALKGLFEPRIKNIRQQYDRTAATGRRNIEGFTNTYMGRLGMIAPQVRANNAQAQQAQAAVGGALADYMRNTGSEISADLTARLGSAVSPTQAASTVGTAAATGVAGSGQVAGMNTASLSRMIDEGNAWENWATALPGIGALEGQRSFGKFMGELTQGYNNQMGDLMASLPEAALSLYQNLRQQDMERRMAGLQLGQMRASYLGDAKQRQLNAALGGAGLLQNWSQMMLQRELGLAGINAQNYGTASDLYAAMNPVFAPPGPGDPGYVTPPQDIMSAVFDEAIQQFPEQMQNGVPTGGYHTMKARIMSFVNGRVGNKLSQAQKQQVRDRILRTLGYKPGLVRSTGKGKQSSSGPTPTTDPGGADLPWDPLADTADWWNTLTGVGGNVWDTISGWPPYR